MVNLVQTCSKQNLKNLNCGQVDLDGSRLGYYGLVRGGCVGPKLKRDLVVPL